MQTINKPTAYEQRKKGPWEEVICHNKTVKITIKNTHNLFLRMLRKNDSSEAGEIAPSVK